MRVRVCLVFCKTGDSLALNNKISEPSAGKYRKTTSLIISNLRRDKVLKITNKHPLWSLTHQDKRVEGTLGMSLIWMGEGQFDYNRDHRVISYNNNKTVLFL